MTNRKKPSQPKPSNPQPPAVAKKHPFKPRKIEPSDHAKYFVVKVRGKHEFELPLDRHESRKMRQLKIARARGILDRWMDKMEKAEEELTPLQFKQLTDAMKNLDTIEEEAYANDVPIKPRTGNSDMDDLDKLMADAMSAGMKVKEKQIEAEQKNQPIDADAEDVA